MKKKMLRFACVLTSLAAALGMASTGCNPKRQEPDAAPKYSGFFFYGGKYMPGPYQVEARDLDILVNGQVVSSIPKSGAASGSAAVALSSPRNAADLADIGAHFLTQKKVNNFEQLTPQLRSQLISLLRSYPAAAQVTDETDSIVVIDKSGRAARLHLLINQPPSADEFRQDQSDIAKQLDLLLKSGGVLLLSRTGDVIQIAPTQAYSFLNSLLDAFNESGSTRSAQLQQLVRIPAIVEELLSAGPPPQELRLRIQAKPSSATAIPWDSPTDGQQSKTRPSTAEDAAAFLPLLDGRILQSLAAWYTGKSTQFGEHLALRPLSILPDMASHRLSHTPKSLNVVLLLTLYDFGASSSLLEAARLHGYNVFEYTSGWGSGPGSVTIDRFLQWSGDVGILYFNAHGDRNSISIEQYRFKSDRDKAYQAYLDRDIPVETGVVDSVPFVTYNYTVDINRRTIAKWKGVQTIVEAASCDSFGLADAFLASGARDFLGPQVEINALKSKSFDNAFWPRMAGTVDNGTKRNVIDAFAAAKPGNVYSHKGEGATVLSPAVAKYSPKDGDSVTVGQQVKATVTFDTPMNKKWLPVSTFRNLTGQCNAELLWGPSTNPGAIGWQDDRTFYFSFAPRQAGKLSVIVDSGPAGAEGSENGAALDGNQIPKGTDHVGPNGDSFQYTLNCMAPPPKTVSQVQETPPPGGQVDSCLVGAWRSESVTSPLGQGGGAGITLIVQTDGTETIDYNGMQPIQGAGSVSHQWVGTASGKITADGKKAVVARVDRSALTLNYTLNGTTHTSVMKGLGPGSLGENTPDPSYTCDATTLKFKILVDTLTYKRQGGATRER